RGGDRPVRRGGVGRDGGDLDRGTGGVEFAGEVPGLHGDPVLTRRRGREGGREGHSRRPGGRRRGVDPGQGGAPRPVGLEPLAAGAALHGIGGAGHADVVGGAAGDGQRLAGGDLLAVGRAGQRDRRVGGVDRRRLDGEVDRLLRRQVVGDVGGLDLEVV